MARRRSAAGTARLALLLGFATACAFASGATGATSTTVVSVTVPSASNIDTSLCATGSTATDFGTMLPGDARVGANCVVTFGSSNDSSMLQLSQADGGGDPMYRPPTGTLASSFSGGTVSADLSATSEYVHELLELADGSILVAGNRTVAGLDRAFVAKYSSTGTLDTNFGCAVPPCSGYLALPNVNVNGDYISDLAVQSDGKVVVAGYGYNAGWNSLLNLRRLNANGTLDGSLSVNTTYTGEASASEVEVMDDGRIVIVGWGQTGTVGGFIRYSALIVRYTSTGAIDPLFNGGAAKKLNITANSEAADSMVLESDGSLFVAGCTTVGAVGAGCATADGFLFKLKADGTGFDTTGFAAPTGYVTLDVGGVANAFDQLVRSPDGTKLYAIGWTGAGAARDWFVARYSTAGVIDPSWNGTGVSPVIAPSAAQDYTNGSSIVEEDGGVFLTGMTYPGVVANREVATARLLPSGLADGSYGPGGVKTWSVGAGEDGIAGSTRTRDGRILLAGWTMGADMNPLLQKLDTTTIASYGAQTWAASTTGMLGVCLRSIGAGTTNQWSLNASCTQADGAWWNAIPTTPTKVAYATAPTQTASATLNFGLRMATNQPPGRYIAPVTFTALAPNA